ncbi:MAG: DUF2892 domain-containing protein [Anaerolineae bacterium]|nr:DUF2892 domain-containing protein [Anaerolineae bacterium]
MALVDFMASPMGRWLRIVVGIVLILIGLLVIEGTGGTVIAIIGLVPLAAGAFDFCVLAPLLGLPFWGRAIRQRK